MSLTEQVEIIDPAIHTVRAVNLPDLHDKGLWLVGLLKDRLPGQQDSHIFSWLRTVIDVRDYHFVRTNHAFALSELKREKMMAQPVVIDHFVYIEEEADVSEGEALYDDMKRWAFFLGASEILINSKSHVPVDMIEARLGKLHKREQRYARVGKA